MRTAPAAAFAVTLAAASAAADEILLRNGGSLVGDVVSRSEQSLVVEFEGGQVTLPTGHVERIVPGPTPRSVFRERASRLASEDVQGWLELALWAREERLDQSWTTS